MKQVVTYNDLGHVQPAIGNVLSDLRYRGLTRNLDISGHASSLGPGTLCALVYLAVL